MIPGEESKFAGRLTVIWLLLAAEIVNGVYIGDVVVPEFQHTMAGGVALVRKFVPVSVSVVGPAPALTPVGLIDWSSGSVFGWVGGLMMKLTGFDNPLLPAPE